jgi:hypothetical protein
MRDINRTVMTAQGPAAIYDAITGSATSRFARTAEMCMSRAHSILVASRAQNIQA